MRVALIAVATALSVALLVQISMLGGSADVRSGTPDTRQSARASVLPDFRLGSDQADAYAAVVTRPLLNPERKPAPKQAVAVATEPPRPQIRRGLYELLGVSEMGAVRVAQVRELASRRTHSVRKGDVLQEMQVLAVEKDRLILAFLGERDEIRLAAYTASGRVPAPPPPPQPPLQPVVAPAVQASVPVPATPAPLPQMATAVESTRRTGAAPVDDREIQRLEALVAQNPTNWNRSRLDTARQQQQGGQPPAQ